MAPAAAELELLQFELLQEEGEAAAGAGGEEEEEAQEEMQELGTAAPVAGGGGGAGAGERCGIRAEWGGGGSSAQLFAMPAERETPSRISKAPK